MTLGFIQLRKPLQSQDNRDLAAYLLQLQGEPFRFFRFSFGDELTLHFGDLHPARSPKLKGRLYGAFILGVRASQWLLKFGKPGMVASQGERVETISKEELETKELIVPDSRVIRTTPFTIQPQAAFGLEIALSDGSLLVIVPSAETEAKDDDLPEIADWELLSPSGRLQAGPGLQWSFEPKAETN
jgi:hypothetical protein